MLRDLQAAVSRLPAKQPGAVLLAGVEGLSYEEGGEGRGRRGLPHWRVPPAAACC
jgi:DNA-directed RNA polymerase specialized sigma24 family protein